MVTMEELLGFAVLMKSQRHWNTSPTSWNICRNKWNNSIKVLIFNATSIV